MSIAPVNCSLQVKLNPTDAFELFTSRMGDWWPKGKTVGTLPHETVVLEPHVGGRWFERDKEGRETPWGHVLAWEPPRRVLLAWQITCTLGFDPALVTEVELTFTANPVGGTTVHLEHRNLERFGTDAAVFAERLREGWPLRLSEFAGWASEFLVYSIPGSPFGRAVLAALEEKGARYRLCPVRGRETKAEAHLRRHPFGRVPALEHGGFALYETQAILRYIDRVMPEPALTPADARAAARMDQALNICDWYLFHGVNNMIVFHRVVGPQLLGLTPDEAAVAASMPKARTVVRELGRLLGDQAYFTGEAVSLADIQLACQLDMLAITPEWAALRSEAPLLDPWLERMRARPSLQATTWEKVEALATPLSVAAGSCR